MTRLLHRAIHETPVAVGGKGIELFDAGGKTYIDASGGAAVSCLGHALPAVIAALHEQLDRLAYAHTGFFSSEVAEQLGDLLIANAPAGLSHAYLLSGGSGSGFFQHGHTYMGHPMAAAAALAVQQTIKRDRLLPNVVEMGVELEHQLVERLGNHHQNAPQPRGNFQGEGGVSRRQG